MEIRISIPQCYTAVGQKPNQEDSLFPPIGKATEESRVFMVCDGMGGHENGEVASACVAETIGKLTACMPLCSASEMQDVFEKALQQAYDNLDELDHSTSSRKMGTTLTFLAICADGVLVAHIGDSRVYQLRPRKGIIFQTRDHSLVNDLIASGEISETEAKTFPQRNVITRAIQPHQDYPAKAAYTVLTDIRRGDLFFLCCDGVVEQLDNEDLCRMLLNGKSLSDRLASIKEECEERDTRDNNTAYLVEIVDAQMENEVKLSVVDEDEITLSPKPNKRTKKRNNLWVALIICLAIIIFIIAYFFNSLPSDEKKDEVPQQQKTEQVQGTIQRHKK